MSQPKVFEFAKQIGMETLALMDKIREWKLPVRSHMAELDPEILETIQQNLKAESVASAAAAKKKKVVKKASAASSGAAETSASTAGVSGGGSASVGGSSGATAAQSSAASGASTSSSAGTERAGKTVTRSKASAATTSSGKVKSTTITKSQGSKASAAQSSASSVASPAKTVVVRRRAQEEDSHPSPSTAAAGISTAQQQASSHGPGTSTHDPLSGAEATSVESSRSSHASASTSASASTTASVAVSASSSAPHLGTTEAVVSTEAAVSKKDTDHHSASQDRHAPSASSLASASIAPSSAADVKADSAVVKHGRSAVKAAQNLELETKAGVGVTLSTAHTDKSAMASSSALGSAPASTAVSVADNSQTAQRTTETLASTSSATATSSSVTAAAAEVGQPSSVATQGSSQGAAAAVTSGASSSASSPARRREVVMTSAGPLSGVKSETPRRNIVGRMDLSRVSPPPSSSNYGGGGPRGAGQHDRGAGAPGQGGAGRTGIQRNLRTGFVAAAPIEIDVEPERKRYDEKKRRSGTGTGSSTYGGPGAGPSLRDRETEMLHFSETEFRKREMVFQPKKKKGLLNREARKTEITKPKASKRILKINENIRVADLAQEMGVKASQLIRVLIQNGVVANMTTLLDFDTAALISPEFDFEVVNVHKSVDELLEDTAFGDLAAEPVLRAPVVTVMGHVDHGKTSLLDAIRKSDVASREAGGITQHIGAYRVTTADGHQITFIDTPGHEAFTAMRARGAHVTDIAVIVVAADDGVMPQTIEAINHAKAAEVPIIVAVNKIDRPNANVDRIKQQLTEFQLVPEEWGGDTIFCETSALQKKGIQELLEQIYLLAEMEELRANPLRSATGIVIESRMDKARGSVATLLVQDGTLRVGQSVVAGVVAGRVRRMINDKGEQVEEAGPATPVEIMGLPEPPVAGDRFDVCIDEVHADKIAAERKLRRDQESAAGPGKLSLEDLFNKMKQGDVKELPLVLKTDVAGSMEAIKGMLDKVGSDEVKLKLVHAAVGGINESDILLASTAKGIVVGFNVRPDSGAASAAKQAGVEIKTYSIVYELMDDLKKALVGLLAPTIVEKELGRAEVRNIFSVPRVGVIAGCAVQDGKITRQSQLRLVRDGKIIYSGKISSLKRFKDDAKEVAAGFECGIGIENYNDIKVGDIIEAYQVETITREL